MNREDRGEMLGMKKRLTAVAISAVVMLSAFRMPARADEGHAYQGGTGFAASFFLIGGQYNLHVNARLTFPAIGLHRSCVFAGNVSRLLPSQDTMHLDPAMISTPYPTASI